MLYGKVQLKFLCVVENNSMYVITIKGSHSSPLICCIDNKQIQKKLNGNTKQ